MAKRLLLLNGVAIICVILFHATGFGFTAMFSWAHRYRDVSSPNYDQVGSTAYYTLRLVEQCVAFCIPAFLFVSGFFVSVMTGKTGRIRGRAVRSRVRNLVTPYLFWSAVAFLAFTLQGRVFASGRYVWMLLIGSSNPNYYYVPLLVQMYFIAPLIVMAVRRNWRAALLTAALVQACVYALQYPVILGLEWPHINGVAAALPKWFFLVHLFWFTFGVVAGLQHPVLMTPLQRHRWVLLACAGCLFILGVVEWECLVYWSGSPWRDNRMTLIDGLYAGAIILSFLAFRDVRIPFTEAFEALGGRSYGIYLVHGLVMEYFSRSLYHFAPWVLGRQLLFQPMVIAVGLSVPLVVMAVIRRSRGQQLYGYLFG